MTTQLGALGPLYGWAQPTQADNWTADMLERLPDDGWLCELIEGRVVRMPPPGPDHARLESKLDYLLRAYLAAHGFGETYVGETGWDLTRPGDRTDTVLASDVAVVRAERLPLPPPRRGTTYRPIAPDLVVEIVSLMQYQPEMSDKARQWLDRGARLVWVVWPERRELDVWMPRDQEPRTLAGDAVLDAGDVIPGLHVLLGEIW